MGHIENRVPFWMRPWCHGNRHMVPEEQEIMNYEQTITKQIMQSNKQRGRARERERARERQRARDRERDTDRQTDRQTD